MNSTHIQHVSTRLSRFSTAGAFALVAFAPGCSFLFPKPPPATHIDGDYTSPLSDDLRTAITDYQDAVKRANWPAEVVWAGVAQRGYDIDRGPLGLPVDKSAGMFMVVRFPASGKCWLSTHTSYMGWAAVLERKNEGADSYAQPAIITRVGWSENDGLNNDGALPSGYREVQCSALDTVKGGLRFGSGATGVAAKQG